MSPLFRPANQTFHEKVRQTDKALSFTFGMEDFWRSMGRGKGWLGAGVYKDTNSEKLYLVLCYSFTCFGSSGIMLRGSSATDELEEGLGEASCNNCFLGVYLRIFS